MTTITRPESAMASFTPISLEDLVARASLLTRVDRKYVLTLDTLTTLLDDLADQSDAAVLTMNGQQDFGYESVYFDTPDLASYRGAAHSRRRRFKVRTRTYLDTQDAYLEVKTRGSRSATVKERIPYAVADRERLTTEGIAYANQALAEAGIRHVDPATMKPVMSTHYTRKTLFIPSSQSRATIDTNLVWTSGSREMRRPEMAIVETKSGQRAGEVDRLLWSHGHRPAQISKYATGMAALNPDLTANKWHRVLTRDF
ncbi:polyphosphate polymerase domain-containing protein [Ornithinimicrobium sp. INDO-MA30-4]|uniref:polyphosphate polymerase domain-containing protein n=1 Tax=Ornithinimicrobium sp. INDO-MA30-4 TaxID=2908651 RepID=UPI001F326864|nr:polyphosphate polymerase domain-containing protein [Ornithinimicrobium sp. INDO-MA30-4]UJH70691.1 polyphosphate polymerase domain-containing protein [Ornithinimicrobium sp. INDO-MA30-4]